MHEYSGTHSIVGNEVLAFIEGWHYLRSFVLSTIIILNGDGDVGKFLTEGRYLHGYINFRITNTCTLSFPCTAPPLPMECSQLRKTTALGTTVVLKYCGLTSPVELSDLDFQWSKRNDGGELVDVEFGERVSVNHNGWLTIKNVQQSDLGVYQANISNEMSNAVHTVQLDLVQATTVQNPPLSQAKVGKWKKDAFPINLKFIIHGDKSISCSDIKVRLYS